MLSTSVVALALLAGTSIAQVGNYSYVDPNTIDSQTAASWCIGERDACKTLCDNDAPTNDCDAIKFTYKCVCSDGTSPNLADYKNTFPDFLCNANFAGCIKAHPDDAVGQGKCKTDILSQCGTLNYTEYQPGSGSGSGSETDDNESSTMSPSPTGTGSTGGGSSADASKTTDSAPSSTEDGDSAPPTTTSNAAMALSGGKDFGAGVLAAGLVAAFGYML